MVYLCLDPSLMATGWAIVSDNDPPILLECGCILTNKSPGLISHSDTQRLDHLATELLEIISKYCPQKILIEDPSGSKSSRANQALSLVKGLTISAAIFSGIQYEMIRAKRIKKALTGDLNAEKEQILQKVKENFKNFDQKCKEFTKVKMYACSDAIAVYLGYINN